MDYKIVHNYTKIFIDTNTGVKGTLRKKIA